MCTVSVIIPTYNREKTLLRAVYSVLNQTYKDIELIIVDDNSNDGTERLINSIKDSRINYIKHDRNVGGSAARNTGILAATGEYVAFQDSDDEWFPDKLSEQIDCIKKYKVDIVFCAYTRVSEYEEEIIPNLEMTLSDHSIYNLLLWKNFIGTPTVLLKSECFNEKLLFDSSLPRYQDWDLWLRLSSKYSFKFLKKSLVRAYIQNDSISKNEAAAVISYERILNKNSENIFKNKSMLAYYYKTIGLTCFSAGETMRSKGVKYLIKVVKMSPLSIEAWSDLIFSVINYRMYIKLKVKLKSFKKV